MQLAAGLLGLSSTIPLEIIRDRPNAYKKTPTNQVFLRLMGLIVLNALDALSSLRFPSVISLYVASRLGIRDTIKAGHLESSIQS